jgi:DNA-binding MarR family transcriptional regulator
VRREPPTIATTIAGLARTFEVVLESQGLTIQKYRVLSYLATEPATPSELAYRLTVRPPTVTRLVDGLVDRGLVARSTGNPDRRRSTLAVTRDGRTALRRANAAINEPLERISRHLDDGQRAIAQEGLLLWGEAMRSYWRATHPHALAPGRGSSND